MGRKNSAAKNSLTNGYWFYYFFASVCPLLRRT
jgi:hypothetical protein